MTAIYLSGDGRMGQALRRLAPEQGCRVVDSLGAADVAIDYSHPDWTGPLLEELRVTPKPLLVGTTGLSQALLGELASLATQVPVLRAANTGTGINVLRRLVAEAARMLPGWDVEVLELHHRRKVDAPSGTAWMLLEDAGGTRETAVPARVGEPGARSEGEIGIQSLRGGDVVGEHTVYLVANGERIELTHRAWDRDTFARGGLRAAHWLATAPPGLHSMNDVLGIR